MGASAEESEDLVQITLVKAYQAWERFDGRHLRSWLIRILRNERLMTLRTARPVSSLDAEDAPDIPQEPFWNELSWNLQAERVLAELDELPEHFRMVIHLCDVEDMSYEQVSEALDVPIGTVRSRLFRGRRMLRERLEPILGNLGEIYS